MDPALLFFFLIIIPSAIIHEYAHGWMANELGDPTAKLAGRLTLNPISHTDLFGTILLPLSLFILSGGRFLFAYAKPVPYNPYNLKDRRWDPVKVAVAGPAANLLIAFTFGLLIRFSLLPGFINDFISIIVYANILLAVFNLVPIPPLDGSKLLYALLPDTQNMMQFKVNLERYGFMILLFFIFFAFRLIMPVMSWLYFLFTGQRIF